MPSDDPEEDWTASLQDLADASGSDQRPCPVCGEMLEVDAPSCKLCGHTFDEKAAPEPDDEFETLLKSTLRTTRGDRVYPDEESSDKEMWEALEEIVQEPQPPTAAPVPVESVQTTPVEQQAPVLWLLGLAAALVGMVAYAVPLTANVGTSSGLALLAVGTVLFVAGFSVLLGKARFRLDRDVALRRAVLPFVLVGVGLVGYLLAPLVAGDAALVVSTMVLGSLLIVMGANAAADLLAARPA